MRAARSTLFYNEILKSNTWLRWVLKHGLPTRTHHGLQAWKLLASAIPVSHGEGKFVVTAEEFAKLWWQWSNLYPICWLRRKPSMDSKYNPNGSVNAIEGITSKNGQIIGKMGHSERFEDGLFKYSRKWINISFASAVKYFTGNKRVYTNDEKLNLLMKNVVFWDLGTPRCCKTTYFGLHSLQHRGQEGRGSLSNDAGPVETYRDTGLLSEVFRRSC